MEQVKRVIDGDTFETTAGQRIRLSGVDAPEVGAPRAKQATEKLREMISDKDVAVRAVGVSYGRVVADVKVGRKSVNNAMNTFLKKK